VGLAVTGPVIALAYLAATVDTRRSGFFAQTRVGRHGRPFRVLQSGYARRCLETVRRLGLEEHARFHGFSDRVTEWYQACHIVLLASRREGLARCMIESLACGTPVVSFDACSAREVLEEHDCGRVVPQGGYAGLAAAYVRLYRALSTAAGP
jgi:glycosyltransferase involved in cell wall biosynthesis